MQQQAELATSTARVDHIAQSVSVLEQLSYERVSLQFDGYVATIRGAHGAIPLDSAEYGRLHDA
jgi:hypothetical protein